MADRPDFEYVIEYRNDEGEWVEWNTYPSALAADRAFERLRRTRPAPLARPVRVILRKILYGEGSP